MLQSHTDTAVICVDSAGNSRQFAGTGRRRGGGDGVPSATRRFGQPTGLAAIPMGTSTSLTKAMVESAW